MNSVTGSLTKPSQCPINTFVLKPTGAARRAHAQTEPQMIKTFSLSVLFLIAGVVFTQNAAYQQQVKKYWLYK